jgi:iron-sulfur cluster repair protein YtfE (RIC family)
MQRERLDLFRNVHKGIRVMLFDLVQKAGRTDFTDITSVAVLRAQVRDTFELLESHAHNEDQFVMPMLRVAVPDLADEFGAAHEAQEAELPALRAGLEALDTSSADTARLGHVFVVRLGRIAGDLLMHMSDEETIINPALWSAYSDEELLVTERRLVGAIPPEKMSRYLRWMLPAMNLPERVGFLSMLPPPVFDFVRAVAKQVLTPAEDLALDARLGAGVA